MINIEKNNDQKIYTINTRENEITISGAWNYLFDFFDTFSQNNTYIFPIIFENNMNLRFVKFKINQIDLNQLPEGQLNLSVYQLPDGETVNTNNKNKVKDIIAYVFGSEVVVDEYTNPITIKNYNSI